jgi:hypothetical protein
MERQTPFGHELGIGLVWPVLDQGGYSHNRFLLVSRMYISGLGDAQQ